MRQLLLFLFLVLHSYLPAQVYIELGSAVNQRDAFGSVNVYGSDGLVHKISYDQLNESPFWEQRWLNAKFFDRRNIYLGLFKARINFINQEVHFLTSKGEEKAVIPGDLSAVVFLDEKDSLKTLTVFLNIIPDVRKIASCKECLIQELNQGHTRLLKISKRSVRQADSLFGTIKVYRVVTETEYFVQSGDIYNRLKRLNKDAFFSFIPGSSRYNDWVKEKGLRFKDESDYLVFLEHYNSTYKKD